jgi:pantoate--beta-alanine ligase
MGWNPAEHGMQLVRSVADMQAWATETRSSGRRIGLVPTMGCLHAGHMSLVGQARGRCDAVVVSIFVNPTQFGPGEDLARYPRDLERDSRLCKRQGVDVLFCPTDADMYPPDYSTFVEETRLAGPLCGRSRPGHFRGVATVVAKLFNIVQPHVAVFGRKDAQQARVIQRMVRDLNFPVHVVVAPIVREPDGLAMSSRNIYLSTSEREAASLLSQGLRRACELFAGGTRSAEALRDAVGSVLSRSPLIAVEYIEAVDLETLRTTGATPGERTLLAVAARIGRTRLIDNAVLPGDPGAGAEIP